jgi:hypothetical protein
VVVLAIGALTGLYLGTPPSAIANALPAFALTAVHPGATTDPAQAHAVALARSAAASAAAIASARARHADQVTSREDPANQSKNPMYTVPTSCNTYTGNRAIGCVLLLDAGFTIDQMPCLDRLWTKESEWNPHSYNVGSGAYGIPQALPGDKIAAFGADWQNNPATQIRWGLDYIRHRYGTPCTAWAHSMATNWY